MIFRSILCLCAISVAPIYGKNAKKHDLVAYQPEQVHIALGDDPLEIVVTWSTFSKTPNSIVEYGTKHKNLRAEGSSKLFVDGGKKKRSQYIHRVHLTGLEPFTRYVYHCGSDHGWSEEFWLRTINKTNSWSPRLAIYGDLGNENAVSLPRLQQETQDEQYDAIIHVGDMAYDMKDDNGRVGDEFMRQLEPIAAFVPYMVTPGNHEEAYNFSHYRERFSMPGPHESLFYSFNMGPVHFVSINTEAYYFLEYGKKLLTKQFDWLKKDLREANEPETRAERPWIILYGHRPMYCSNFDEDYCDGVKSQRVRTGLPHSHKYGLEKLLHKYNVDVAFWGHEHSYERLWPVYDNEMKKGRQGLSYYNPKATVHITSGSAGCKELITNFTLNPEPWSAVRSIHYGYMVLKAHNLTHLHFSQIAVDQGNNVIDDFWIEKGKHRKHPWFD